jgi:hypothetical protein
MKRRIHESPVYFWVYLVVTVLFWIGAAILIWMDPGRIYYLVVPLVMTAALYQLARDRRRATKLARK